MFGKTKKEQGGVVYATQNGIMLPLQEMPDEIFATKVLGDGICLLPDDGKVYAPVTGIVESVADASHAFGIVALDGADIMIHIGVDTVELKGQGFKSRVHPGGHVKTGDLLCEVDLSLLKKTGYASHTAILLTNLDQFEITGFGQGNAFAGKTMVFQYQKRAHR
jgi:glucose-specific phosphotransferase system IIA component